MSDNNTQRTATPILGILGLIFVTLKLTGTGVVATWSWWWVTVPFWGGIAIMFGIVFLLGITASIGLLISALRT